MGSGDGRGGCRPFFVGFVIFVREEKFFLLTEDTEHMERDEVMGSGDGRGGCRAFFVGFVGLVREKIFSSCAGGGRHHDRPFGEEWSRMTPLMDQILSRCSVLAGVNG
jgi:hypothetical protein